MVELGSRRTYRKGAGRKLSAYRLRAPYFYPKGAADKAAIQRVKVPPYQLLVSDT